MNLIQLHIALLLLPLFAGSAPLLAASIAADDPNFWELTREKSAQAWEATRDGAGKAAEWTREKSEQAWEATKQGAETGAGWIGEAIGTDRSNSAEPAAE